MTRRFQGEATLTFPQTLVLRYGLFSPPPQLLPSVARDYAKWFHARLRPLAGKLKDREYLVEGRFTAADVSLGYALLLASQNGLSSGFAPEVADYWIRLQEREGYKRATEREREEAIRQGVDPESPVRPVPL